MKLRPYRQHSLRFQQHHNLQLQDDGPQEKSMNLADKVLIGEGGNVMTRSAEGPSQLIQSTARSFLKKLKM